MIDRGKQRKAILDYIEKHGSITVFEAEGMHITSPTKVISDMKKMGYDLKSEWITVPSAWSSTGTTRVKRYTL